jgi:hypothetical protein
MQWLPKAVNPSSSLLLLVPWKRRTALREVFAGYESRKGRQRSVSEDEKRKREASLRGEFERRVGSP